MRGEQSVLNIYTVYFQRCKHDETRFHLSLS